MPHAPAPTNLTELAGFYIPKKSGDSGESPQMGYISNLDITA
jgi:hypothetical protein